MRNYIAVFLTLVRIITTWRSLEISILLDLHHSITKIK